MAIGMNQRRRSVFGPSSSPAMPQSGPQMGGMPAGQGFQQPEQQKPGLGTRLLGEGWEGKAAALGAAFQGNANAVPNYLADQQFSQQQAAQQAEAQRQASMQAAAADQQWYQREQWKRDNPADDAFGRSLAGAGIDPESEQGRDLYRQRAGTLAGGQDEFVVVPIPGRGTYAGPKSGLPAAVGQSPQGAPQGGPVGRLSPIGGQSQPTIQNTPAPQLSADGMPTSLTSAQYQAVVAARGQAATDEWARRNNIRVTN